MRRNELSAADRRQLLAHGLSEAEVARQIALLASPPPPIRLLRPATVGDGILRLDSTAASELLATAEEAASQGRLTQFVPASGAATRMFGSALAVLDELRAGTVDEDTLAARAAEGDKAAAEALRLIDELERLPFFAAWEESLRTAGGAISTGRRREPRRALEHLLSADRLGLAERPKGLLPFHTYPDGPRTAFEEHLAEAAALAGGGSPRLHFTVSREHTEAFAALYARKREELTAERAPRVSFSCQEPATDTIALDPDGNLVRHADGSLLLRPGGHGSLLWNLGRSQGDVVLIKNIDNVPPESRLAPVVRSKKLLVGLLVSLQDELFHHLAALDRGPTPAELEAAAAFAAERFGIPAPPAGADSPTRASEWLRARLHRPLRVCGMVENRGEPGGGPFWVETDDGESLQIVESAQVARDDPAQEAIFRASTHFNPVDLVCGLRDHRGEPHDLDRFADPATAFVTEKSAGGRPLRALEHPGLWNGAMARWLTVFVEVPPETFNPVKTVLDLLRPEHQG